MPQTHDYLAELYVAGLFADAGWNVYFPHRDEGFDFIIAKSKGATQIIRPVQVKGKYPTAEKKDFRYYGYRGKLSQVHPEMVLAIPYFSQSSNRMPVCTAFLPRSLIRNISKGHRCQPASFAAGTPAPRRDYRKFFDDAGLRLIETPNWSQSEIGKT